MKDDQLQIERPVRDHQRPHGRFQVKFCTATYKFVYKIPFRGIFVGIFTFLQGPTPT